MPAKNRGKQEEESKAACQRLLADEPEWACAIRAQQPF
jgi:hypothetical protein